MGQHQKYDETTLFGYMVESAFEFLNKSLDEYESSPKFSIVHFATAIELVLKARLLKEHWALVVESLDSAKRSDFFTGKAKTINPGTAILRLKNIAGVTISDEAEKIFARIFQHRNRVIHFVHGVSRNLKEAEAELEKVAAEQCLGWLFLHALLNDAWSKQFSGFKKDILSLEIRMQRHRRYLDAKFKAKECEIKEYRASGGDVRGCPSCNYDSLFVDSLDGNIYSANCAVCWYSGTVVKVECPHDRCFQIIEFDSYSGPPGYCPSCQSPIESCISDTLDTGPAITSDNYFDHVDKNCPFCSGYHTVVEHHEGYVCTKCFEYSTDLGYCGWCNEGQLGGVPEGSSYMGCDFCDGNVQWDKD